MQKAGGESRARKPQVALSLRGGFKRRGRHTDEVLYTIPVILDGSFKANICLPNPENQELTL